MARYTGPKNKISRREGVDLFNKGMKLRKLNVPPGVHGPKSGRSKKSEFGLQLRDKQLVKRFYGLLEKQFKNYYLQANNMKGTTGDNLIQLIERRLDNFLVRAELAPTRAMARQMVVHGHVLVDGQKVDRPSYQLKPDQVVTLSDKAQKMPAVLDLNNQEDHSIPKWIQKKATVCKMSRLPERDDVSEEFNIQAIIEFYSR